MGVLVLVATPIGNLGDLSERAVETLRHADVIACEDTRHTRKLLNHADIHGVRTMAVHEHNEMEAADKIVRMVADGKTVALVSDAGMPTISDPGERVVAAVAAAGLKVSAVPGPSAIPAALAVSGLPTSRFCFEGFLPRKKRDRDERLRVVADEERTTVLYEAPHRLELLVAELIEQCGEERHVVLVRELTKIHEEVWRGSLKALLGRIAGSPVKGECVIVLAGATPQPSAGDDEILNALRNCIAEGLSRKDAVAKVTGALGASRNHVYRLLRQL